MPLDPSIILGGRAPAPIPTPSPLDLLGTVERVQSLREATEQRRLAGEDRRAKAQDEAAARARALQVEQTLQGAMSIDPTTQRPTVDWTKLLGHVPSGTLFTVQKEIAEAEQRVATLRNTNLTGEEKALQYQGIVARPVAAAGYDKTLFDQAVNAAHKAGAITTEQRDAGLALTDPADIKRTTDAAIARAQEWKPPEGFTLGEGQTRYDATGKLIVAAPVKPVKEAHSPIYTEWQDYQSTGGTLPFDQYQTVDANRRRAVTHINAGQGQPGDLKEVIAGMKDGTLPPALPGRGSTAYTGLMAEAHRQGFDLATAATDWTAAQKHFATLNGAQQTRLRQAVDTAAHSLDVIDTLAGQWKGGSFPILNRANLALAKNGAYGADVAATARALDAQIADVTAELANAYMGGNSPTDHALKLAAKNLSSDWSEATLKQMTALARTNLKIRQNAIKNVGAIGASDENPYVPGPATSTVRPKRYNPATGKVEQAMAEKLIDIPGVGPVTFPESMTEDEINKAAGKLYAEANPKHPPAAPSHSWVDTAVDWVPAVGGAVGGLVGGVGGTVAGVGVGGVPGALGGAALGGAGGEALKQLLNRARGAEAPATSSDAARSIAGQAALQAGAEAAGGVIGAGMKMAAPRVMQAAVKPTLKMLGDVMKGAPVPRVVQTLLDEGVNVTAGGLAKLNKLLATSQQELKTLLAGAEASGAPGVSPYAVTSRLGDVAKDAASQVNPAADVATVARVGNEFLAEHGGQMIPLTEANALKAGTYRTLRKNYGTLGSYDIESQKALARGLKEEIEHQAGGAEALNQKVGNYTEAVKAVGRRVAVLGNRDPVGFAWVAHNPQMFLAALMDRSPAVKSMLARGLYQSAGRVAQVSPQLIRAAVLALTTAAPDGAPAPE